MVKNTGLIRTGILVFTLLITCQGLYSQRGFDNPTRALYIFDLSKYIGYGPGFSDPAYFTIGILIGDYDLVHEMANLAKTRTSIQGKPVLIMGFKNIESITHTQVLYLHKNSGQDINKVKSKITGRHTMLITEGYEFRESMINFIVVDGKPRYDINEELIKKEGMSIPAEILYMAVKTREDWENLFQIASGEIEVQKMIISEQTDTIILQRDQIQRQKYLLDSLDREVKLKQDLINQKQKIISSQSGQISRQQQEISSQKRMIAGQYEHIKVQLDTIENQQKKIGSQQTLISEQSHTISQQAEKIMLQLEAIEKQKLILLFTLIALLLSGILGYNIYRNYRIKKEVNIELEEKNRTISVQRDELASQRDLAAAQRDQIAYQKKHITDSIEYARRIQTALIPSLELFSDKLEHFVLYKPLAVASGDFYWISTNGKKQVIISADCTGHGIAGAFMSMLGVSLLNEIVNGKQIMMPDQIIENLRQGVIRSLNQVEDNISSVNDGMDIAVCTIDFEEDILLYAGANSPLYFIRGNELSHYRPDRMPASFHFRMRPFTLHRLKIQKGDSFFIFSDGFANQPGGPQNKKIMSVRLKEILMEISDLPMLMQGEKLNEIFEEWRGNNAQIDDITFIGVRY